MSEQPDQPTEPEPDVRPQRPRPAPPAPAWPEPPDAWQGNPRVAVRVILLLNWVLFAYICLVFSRLTTGQYWPQDKWALCGQGLGRFMLSPISIYEVPLEGVVLAIFLMLMGVGVLLTSQYYGPGWSLLFIALTVGVAHMPLLAASLVAAVLVANTRLLGIRNRFVRGTIALLLPGAAMWLSTARTSAPAKSPIELIYLHFAWVAAVAGAIVVMMLFWVTARLLRYRPGLLTLFMGLMLIGGGGLFYYGVGLDELEFGLLQKDYGLNSRMHFFNRSVAEQIDRLVHERLLEDGITDPTEEQKEGCRGLVRTYPLKPRIEADLAASRKAVGEACEQFMRSFPTSRHQPYVLFLLARSLDMKLDLAAFTETDRVEHYDDVVTQEGFVQWRHLLMNHPAHPLAIVAGVRAGHWMVARGEVKIGLDMLKEAYAHWQRYQEQHRRQQEEPSRSRLSIFMTAPREPVSPELIQERIGKLPRWIWQIEQNRGTPRDDEALSELFSLNPRDTGYVGQLAKLQQKYKGMKLADDLDLIRRLRIPDEAKRIEALRAFIRTHSSTGSAARYEAMAELAKLLVKGSAADRDQASKLWGELKSTSTPFADEARRGLVSLGVSPDADKGQNH